MKALISYNPGGPETLVLETVPDPEPKAGEVLVAIKACGCLLYTSPSPRDS